MTDLSPTAPPDASRAAMRTRPATPRPIEGPRDVVARHHSTRDRAAEVYAMVTRIDAGSADPHEVARAFGCSTRSLRRDHAHDEAAGLATLVRGPGRPPSPRLRSPRSRRRDQTMRAMTSHRASKRTMGSTLGIDARVVRRTWCRLGSRPAADGRRPCSEQTPARPAAATAVTGRPQVTTPRHVTPCEPTTDAVADAGPLRLDRDPLTRSMDRRLAAMGSLDEAAPLVAATDALRRAGAILAMPARVAAGWLSVARRVYGRLGPVCAERRTTLVALVRLVLRRMPRPEMLEAYAPGDVGRVIGLDSMPEGHTRRRQRASLAAKTRRHEVGRELATHHVDARGRVPECLDVDGHVRTSHGTRTIATLSLTRTRTAGPGTTDDWINDQQGEPRFLVTAEANAAMTRRLVPRLHALGPRCRARQRITVVCDRAGWSPTRVRQIVAMGLDIVTDRKGRCRRVAEPRVVRREARVDGRRVAYRRHDQPVRFLQGSCRLRQVTRLTETGHQVAIGTSRWDLRDRLVASRLCEQWRQQHGFTDRREACLIDTRTDDEIEPDDPHRVVSTPARTAADHAGCQARVHLAHVRDASGATALDALEGRTPTTGAVTREETRLPRAVHDAADRLATLVARRTSLAVRLPLADVPPAAEAVTRSTNRTHLTHVLKRVAVQAEGSLVERVEPHDDERRTWMHVDADRPPPGRGDGPDRGRTPRDTGSAQLAAPIHSESRRVRRTASHEHTRSWYHAASQMGGRRGTAPMKTRTDFGGGVAHALDAVATHGRHLRMTVDGRLRRAAASHGLATPIGAPHPTPHEQELIHG